MLEQGNLKLVVERRQGPNGGPLQVRVDFRRDERGTLTYEDYTIDCDGLMEHPFMPRRPSTIIPNLDRPNDSDPTPLELAERLTQFVASLLKTQEENI